jgi:hypothetical membrane protein
MSTPLWFVIFYPVAVAIFLIMLCLSIRLYKGYSIFTRIVSDLGRKNTLSCKIYNKAIVFYSIINLTIIYFLFVYLNQHFAFNIYGLIGLIFFAISSIFGIILGFVLEEDGKKGDKHNLLAGIMFFGYMLGSLMLVYPFIISKLFWIMPFTLLSLVIFIFFLIASFNSWPYVLSNVRKPIIKNICFWEWMLFLSMILWLFLVYIAMVIA